MHRAHMYIEISPLGKAPAAAWNNAGKDPSLPHIDVTVCNFQMAAKLALRRADEGAFRTLWRVDGFYVSL